MIILTGNIAHPNAPTVAYSNAYVVVENISIRELQAKLVWSCNIWATKADRDNGLPPVLSDSGTIPYDDAILPDTQLQSKMIAGTSGGTVDYSQATAPA
jgi:hypothetical protein